MNEKALYEQEQQTLNWKEISDLVADDLNIYNHSVRRLVFIAMRATSDILKDGMPVSLGRHFGFDIKLKTYIKKVIREREIAKKKTATREYIPVDLSQRERKTDRFNRSDFIVVRIKEGVLGLGYVEDILSDTEIQVNVVYSVFKQSGRYFIKLLPDCLEGVYSGTDFLNPQTGNKLIKHILPEAFPATTYDTVRKNIIEYQT